MNLSKRMFSWFLWPTAIVVVLVATYFLWRNEQRRRPNLVSNGVADHSKKTNESPPEEGDEPPQLPETISVKILHPRRGAMERLTTQVGSVQAKETVELYSRVSGYLKSQSVDIGYAVKKGDVLAVVDVPDLEIQAARNTAAVELCEARVEQTKAKVAIANADIEAAKAQVVQAEANSKSAKAWVGFRSKQYQRMKDLFTLASIEERLVDENKERYEASVESANAAIAAIATAKAQLMSASAKIRLAEADVVEAQSQVKVAAAELDKSKQQLKFAEIVAPFDGTITHRLLFPRDFVRSADVGGAGQPLLTIQRTDLMRVIVQVPDRDVRYADPEDAAIVEIDAFPGEKFRAKISRIAKSESKETRQMPVEIDLPNPAGKILQGMFGRVTIVLDKASDQLSIPSNCLVGKAGNGKGTVYVVRKGKAHLVPVHLGNDNGVRVEILQGLTTEDQVIQQPRSILTEGSEVETSPGDEPQSVTAAQP